MSGHTFVWAVYLVLRKASTRCPIVLVRDAVQTYQDVTGQLLPPGNKTWFRYVQKAMESSIMRCEKLNCQTNVFLKHHWKMMSKMKQDFGEIEEPEKYREENGRVAPVTFLLCKEVYQVVKEDRSMDFCYQTEELSFCNFEFNFHLNLKLKLNLTFLKLTMSGADCVLTNITVKQKLMPKLNHKFCGTYTPFTIYTKSSHVKLTYTFDIEANYQSVFAYSVIDPEEVISFPCITMVFNNDLGTIRTAGQHTSFSLIKPTATPTPHTTALYVYFIEVARYLEMVVCVTGCVKGSCYESHSPFPQEVRQTHIVSETGTMGVAGFQYILLYVPSHTHFNKTHQNHLEIGFQVSKAPKEKTRNITLQPGEKNITVFEARFPNPRVHIWDIFYHHKDGQYIEVLILNMLYRENVHSAACQHGGFSSYEFNSLFQDFVVMQTICSDYMKYVGNKKLYSSGEVLRLVFYHYFHNLFLGSGPYSYVVVKLGLSTQPCYPVTLDVCSYRIGRNSAEKTVYERTFEENRSFEWRKAGLEGNVSSDGELVLAVHSNSKCVVIQVSSVYSSRMGIVRCHLKIRPKVFFSEVGAGVGLFMAGCYLSNVSELRVHHNPNVYFKMASISLPVSESRGLRIIPKCTKGKYHFWRSDNCGVSDTFDKSEGIMCVQSPFNPKDLVVELYFLPHFNSWVSLQFYYNVSNKSFFSELFNRSTKPIQELRLPFLHIVRVWHPENETEYDFVSNNVLLLLETKPKRDIQFNVLLKLKVWREWNERGNCGLFVKVLCNKFDQRTFIGVTPKYVTSNTRVKLFLSLQGDVPQYISHQNKTQSKDENLRVYLIHNFLRNISPEVNSSKAPGNLTALSFQFEPAKSQVIGKSFIFVENQITDHCHRPLVSWKKAQEICRGINATLPILRSITEQVELTALIKLSKNLLFIEGLFIGIYRAEHNQVCQIFLLCSNQ